MVSTRKWTVKPRLEVPTKEIVVGPGASEAGPSAFLGEVVEATNRAHVEVSISLKSEQVVAVCGKRGSGKSFTLGVLAESFAVTAEQSRLGNKPKHKAALLLDPLDIYWSSRFPVSDSKNAAVSGNFKLAKAAKLDGHAFDVEIFIPGTAFRRESDPDWIKSLALSASELTLNEWELALSLNITQDPAGQALMDCLRLVKQGYTASDGTAAKGKKDFDLTEIQLAASSQDIENTYHRETIRSLRQKLHSLAALGIFGEEPTPLSEFIRAGRLTILMLNRLPDSLRDLVVALVTRKIMDSRAKAAFAEKRAALDTGISEDEREELLGQLHKEAPKTTIFLDEAQNFLSPSTNNSAKGVFIKLVKEGRNFGMSVVVATQQPSAIDKQIMSQVETFVSHQLVTETDLQSLESNLKSPVFTTAKYGPSMLPFRDLVRSLNRGECVISSSEASLPANRAFILRVRPRATMHGGVEL